MIIEDFSTICRVILKGNQKEMHRVWYLCITFSAFPYVGMHWVNLTLFFFLAPCKITRALNISSSCSQGTNKWRGWRGGLYMGRYPV